MRLFPERIVRRRQLLPAALLLSLLVHAVGGGLAARFARFAPHAPPPTDDAAVSDKVAIERLTPTPVPTPRATPRPTPTPVVLPHPRPAVARPATAPRVASTAPPAAAPLAPREIARVRPHAPPPPRMSKHGAYSQAQLDAMSAQFRSTIASAQQAAAEAPQAQTGGSDAGSADKTMKRYRSVPFGPPADVLGGGLCDNLSESSRGDRTYIYWQCRIHYSDGYTETVAFPWPFIYPRGHTPKPNESFPEQPPPEGFALPQVFALSREVCAYFRDRCDAVIRRERASGDASDYGTPP